MNSKLTPPFVGGEQDTNPVIDNLKKALNSLDIREGELDKWAEVLAFAQDKEVITYDEIKQKVKEDQEDLLLLAYQYRLLIPLKTDQSLAWEYRDLQAIAGEKYKMPRIVKYLVENGKRAGKWNPELAIVKVFKDMEEPLWDKMPKLVQILGQEAVNYKINGYQIKDICINLGLKDQTGRLIAELKGSGIMSPKLSSFAAVSKAGSPIYELNPSIVDGLNTGKSAYNDE